MRVRRKSADKALKDAWIQRLNTECGGYFCSSFEYPGRYTRWDMGCVNPPIGIETFGRRICIQALNEKGQLLLKFIFQKLKDQAYFETISIETGKFRGQIREPQGFFSEEQRSRQSTVFSMLRTIQEAFFSPADGFLGFYGAFGYDLIFQFESIPLTQHREADAADMLLFIPDEIFVIDHQKDDCFTMQYDFMYAQESTEGKDRRPYVTTASIPQQETLPVYEKGKYAQKVQNAMDYFKRGDFFEVVPSHSFYQTSGMQASDIFQNLVRVNPSPYGFLINLGKEHLIGASPEMYVRVEGKRVETCPISGTIRRGANAVEDAAKILELLNSKKDASELTMCTDVDRNDKSRICVPGTVNVIGRRQIEMYSHLIHTVDHVEGILAEEYDGLDAFMTHMWAVTVTGAPKRAAIGWIEKNEEAPRKWYGGAVGCIGFDGNINTGLTLRTIRLRDGTAQIRVGATVLYDSIPEEEEEETRVKAAALIKVLQMEHEKKEVVHVGQISDASSKTPLRVLLIDHEDSFVHTLGSYFRRAGCVVETLRHTIARQKLLQEDYDLVVLSPGPGRPADFKLADSIRLADEKGIPVFGVCLGLQGLVEYFGGQLGILDYPMHGKQSAIKIAETSILFKGISQMQVGRYHSLHGLEVPDSLRVTARTEDDVVMAIEAVGKEMFGVQFHPESILSMEGEKGYQIILNVLERVKGGKHG